MDIIEYLTGSRDVLILIIEIILFFMALVYILFIGRRAMMLRAELKQFKLDANEANAPNIIKTALKSMLDYAESSLYYEKMKAHIKEQMATVDESEFATDLVWLDLKTKLIALEKYDSSGPARVFFTTTLVLLLASLVLYLMTFDLVVAVGILGLPLLYMVVKRALSNRELTT